MGVYEIQGLLRQTLALAFRLLDRIEMLEAELAARQARAPHLFR